MCWCTENRWCTAIRFSAALTRGTQLPPVDLVPLDESGGETAVTWDNLGETVFLTLDDEGGAT
ncbi:hypothetical protein [Ruminococcus sp.]|uniref:phage baseplate plug family protein n=1 Tax=Ruminococcus sp. TaxID=41978 RepID=UPI00300ED157